jgi:DNA-binding response OmpR family regulator
LNVRADNATVLLLEDDLDILEATTLILEDEGFRVVSAGEGRAAVDLARAERPSVVLLDLSIDEDPRRLVAALRSAQSEGARVLLFSAGDRLAERARALGADGALAKPFEIHELLAALADDSACCPAS